MRYDGTEALDLWGQEAALREERRARDFTLHEGGRGDADARQGVAPEVVTRTVILVVVFTALVALGCLRVFLCSQAAELRLQNTMAMTSIEEAQSTNAELKLTRSELSSESRITTIAAQNFGMVNPTQTQAVTE